MNTKMGLLAVLTNYMWHLLITHYSLIYFSLCNVSIQLSHQHTMQHKNSIELYMPPPEKLVFSAYLDHAVTLTFGLLIPKPISSSMP